MPPKTSACGQAAHSRSCTAPLARWRALACTIFAALLTFTAQLCEAGEPEDLKPPRWERIVYPKLPIPGEAGRTFDLEVESSQEDGKSHLWFFVSWFVKSEDPEPASLAGDKMTVRLHRTDGSSIKTEHAFGPVGIGNQVGLTWSLAYPLPWGPNVLDEAWIELRLPGQTYWLELPYGFTRDPDAAPAPADDPRGGPEFAPAMKNLPKEDRLVPWLKVDYDLGETQDQGRLSAGLTNPIDAHAEMTLNRDPTAQAGRGAGPWKMDSPKVAIKILDGPEAIGSRCTNIHLDEFGIERVETFDFNRDPASHRSWGTAVATVAKKEYRFSVPSSLFKYGHGDADLRNPQWIKR